MFFSRIMSPTLPVPNFFTVACAGVAQCSPSQPSGLFVFFTVYFILKGQCHHKCVPDRYTVTWNRSKLVDGKKFHNFLFLHWSSTIF